MASLNKDSAALFTKRLMQAHMRASNPRTSGITTMLILKDAIDYKDFFTAIMSVWIEIGLWSPADQGRSLP